MRPIMDVAAELGLDTQALIPQGHYKAKIPLSAERTGGKRGKLIVVTGITPTPAGEGKTTTTVGMAQGFGRLGKKVVATLREPSLGPIFGIKGGGTGGGLSLVEPQDEVNIHFTGDAHGRWFGAQPARSADGQCSAAWTDSRFWIYGYHLAAGDRCRGQGRCGQSFPASVVRRTLRCASPASTS